MVAKIYHGCRNWNKHGYIICPGNDAKLIRCALGMTLNLSVVAQGMTVNLQPCLRFRACRWGCVRWKAPCRKGCGWADMARTFEYVLHFVRCVLVTMSPKQIHRIVSFPSFVTISILYNFANNQNNNFHIHRNRVGDIPVYNCSYHNDSTINTSHVQASWITLMISGLFHWVPYKI